MSDETKDRRPLSPSELRGLRWWVERFGVDDPRRGPVHDVDPQRLESAGWGVIYAPEIGPETRQALEPLLRHRGAQAGRFFKEFTLEAGESKQDFLARQKAPPGPADPRLVPYYLLIVGDPRTIPFRFQYELDVQYAVGRLCFETPDEYANYARSVVHAETTPPARPKKIAFFGTTHAEDRGTERTTFDFIAPLAEALSKSRPDWRVDLWLGPQATKEQLGQLLGGGETPALLFSATHGLAFPPEDPLQLSDQGALVCQDWPGPGAWEGGLLPEHSFTARDVRPAADLQGTIVIHFGDFGAGSLEYDSFDPSTIVTPRRIAPYPFVARLPQRLLGHPNGGALAMVAQIDRSWTLSFSWTDGSQVQMYEHCLRRLLQGSPVGSATEYFNQRYAELAVETSVLWEDQRSGLKVSRDRFDRTRRAMADARSWVVLGDPAVRLTFRDS